MAVKKHGIDTTPIILQRGVKWPNGNPATIPLIDDPATSITVQYDVEMPGSGATSVTSYGLYGNIVSWNGDTYRDYWGQDSRYAESTKTGITSRCTKAAFTVVTALIDDCYAYHVLTGQIFFAGKNSIYYGHRNISELN